MKNINILYTFLAVFAISCSNNKYEKFGNIQYVYTGKECSETKNHWLVDISAKDAKDSTYLDTRTLKRKLELHRLQLDTSSNLYYLLKTICPGDSISLKLEAKSFYVPLGGVVPSHLKDSDQIKVDFWMRDKLGDQEHIAYKKLFELQAMAKYVKNARWNAIRDKETGIYYEMLKTSKNPSKSNSTINLKYVIKGLNEQLIAFNKETDPLVLTEDTKGILKGILFLSEQLNEGESLRAVVPSSYAYGSNGNARVQGYMPVIIELENIKRSD